MLLLDAPVLANHTAVHAADQSELAGLFNQTTKPHVTQAPAYAYAKQAHGGWQVRRLEFESDGRPVAICHVLEKSVLGFRIARINRGPLFLKSDPAPSTIRAVYSELRAAYRIARGGILSIAPALEHNAGNAVLLADLGFRDSGYHGWCSSLVDLTKGEDQLRKSLNQKWRNRLSSAERSGLELHVSQSDEHFEWLLQRHREHAQSKGFRSLGVKFLRAYRDWQPCDCFVLQARLAGHPVAGMLVTRLGQKAEGLVLVCTEGRGYNAGNFLFWNAMLEMKRTGCAWWDMGGHGYKPGNFKHFKEGVRGVEYRLMGEWLSL
jgi:lipid II:glycine glycyltransferase (peptidoglycan interpeptide bridge formation enzyme)